VVRIERYEIRSDGEGGDGEEQEKWSEKREHRREGKKRGKKGGLLWLEMSSSKRNYTSQKFIWRRIGQGLKLLGYFCTSAIATLQSFRVSLKLDPNSGPACSLSSRGTVIYLFSMAQLEQESQS